METGRRKKKRNKKIKPPLFENGIWEKEKEFLIDVCTTNIARRYLHILYNKQAKCGQIKSVSLWISLKGMTALGGNKKRGYLAAPP